MTKLFCLLLVVCSFYFISCNNSQSENADVKKKKIEKYIDYYNIIPDKSLVNWTRVVDNKLIKKKVKLFGSYVDVNMENVKFDSNGSLEIKSAEFKKLNNIWNEGMIEIPLTTFKFYSDDEEQFFVQEDMGNARLQINEITADTSLLNIYNLNCVLNIADSSKKISFPAEFLIDSLQQIKINGEFVLQTLDWPFRKNADRQNVRKDEITLKLDLCLEKIKTDTIIE
ncbi:MAG: hypothetical protein ABIJ97_00630 [Bacteroidota bacterium]